MEEIEVKFLNIDLAAMQAKLQAIGAVKVGEYFYRRHVFDYPDLRLNSQGAWIRLRDEGNRVVLAFKQRKGAGKNGANDQSMEEIEVIVSDFDKTKLFLEKVGFMEKFYEENRRIRWVKDDIEFDLDTWPNLNPYLEIEAPSWEKIDQAIVELGLNQADKKIFSTFQIYEQNGINELEYSRLTFDGLVKKEKNNMKIVISASMQFAEKMFEVRDQLNKLGHQAFIDDDLAKSFLGKSDHEKETIKIDQKNNRDAIRRYWELMQDKDALLVLNFDKNGVKNYIGGNVLLEIGFAHVLNQKIFLFKPVPEISYYKSEIEAVKPVIINGDLSKIV